jgi:hypothetical protein
LLQLGYCCELALQTAGFPSHELQLQLSNDAIQQLGRQLLMADYSLCSIWEHQL